MAVSEEKIRTFVAIDLPAEVKSFLEGVTRDLKKTGADVKWARPEGTHLTLKFLGNVDRELVSHIDAQLRPMFAQVRPFVIGVGSLGGFPSLNRPRVIWVGVHDGDGSLQPAVRQVESLLEPLGFEPEKRPFSPHLTLGRVRSNRGIRELVEEVRQRIDLTGPRFSADHATLFQSILKPSGAEYRPLAAFPFSGN